MEKYTKLNILGRGAFGIVYKVRDNTTDKEYAMKILPIGNPEDFKNEAELMKMVTSLSSPHTVKYIESFAIAGQQEHIIIMEYCSGGSLRTVINEYKKKREKIPEETIIKYMTQILLGVDYIHKKRILHRDLKPENLMIDDEGDVKVSDFGLAKQLTSTSAYARTRLGTMSYSSLEVLDGANAIKLPDIALMRIFGHLDVYFMNCAVWSHSLMKGILSISL